MGDFRAALEQFLAGTVGPEEARQRIGVAAANEPAVAPAMLAVIETYRSAGRLTPQFAAELQQVVQRSAAPGGAAAPDDATNLSAQQPAVVPPKPVVPPPIPAPPPISAPQPTLAERAASASGGGVQLSLGSVLKGRFVLESIVAGGDKGGMGVVYKALDRIKQEAQDRNLYVAIKVLNEDFRRHPDSMMALQREARRAQTLAHPNIITVYDFDRDGDTVFMAMELLSGSPLDVAIRDNRERGGLPTQEALHIIKQLASGLSYAHANNIVHSDFKPGNAFLTKEGVVKVLDFGIARATKLPDGEKTRFDAGSLGAMTLPYASCEQFERQDPDPSDDVYALSVVSYELLTGRHPFERPDPNTPGRIIRTDAISARNAKMKPVPSPVPGVTRQQSRTLQRGLAFKRADRLRNAAEFLDGMTPRKLPMKSLMTAIAAVLLLLVTSTMLLSSYMHRSRLQALTQQLQSKDGATLTAALQALQKYPLDERSPVLLNDAVQGNLLNYYIGRAHEQFNVEAGKYDYTGALATLKDASMLGRAYEDSRQLTDAMDRLESERKAEILREADAFESQLAQGVLIASQGPQNVRSTLAVIRQLDPNHPLLNDTRLPIAFAAQVRANIESQHLALATALLAAGLLFAPGDPGLLDLQDRISRQQSAAQLSAQSGELEQAVQPLAGSGATLADFRSKLPQLQALRRAQPDSAVFAAAQDRLTRLIDPMVASAIAQHQVGDAQSTLNEFADLLPTAFVVKQRTGIASVTGDTQVRDSAAEQLRAKIDKETASPQSDDTWVNTLQRDLKNLEAIAGANDPAIAQARSRTSQGFLAQSKGLLASHRLTEAQRVLDLARQFGLSTDVYQAQASDLAQAHTQLEAENRARESSAQLVAAKQRVLDQALADHIDVAESQFAQLQKTLPANDAFITTDAPRAIAEAYLVRARRAAGQTRFDLALQNAQSAQQAAPALPEFKEALQRFQSASELAHSFETVEDFRPLRGALEQLRDAERASGNRAIPLGLLRVVVDRLNRVGAQDPATAMRLRASAMPLFPYTNLPSFNAAAAAHPAAAPGLAPSQSAAPLPAPAATPTPSASAEPQTMQQPSTAPTPSPFPKSRPKPASISNEAQSVQTAPPVPGAATSVATSVAAAACNALPVDAAGGTACRDTFDKGERGPELVLIPAGIELGRFAMMRNEASIGDYNAYCVSSKGCTPVSASDPNLPITSISVDDAQKYAAWLTVQSGAKYRLPMEREWKRAAARVRDADANCLAGGSGRGSALRSSMLGALNDFGMRNVVGNVQEWATSAAGGLKALGGAIGDPIEICQTEFSRPHNGQADGRTGFRLLREMH
jgi:serine/threonine protein kinase